ncbi:MAG: hypothetical protein QW814_02780 [Methanothrix sp.]
MSVKIWYYKHFNKDRLLEELSKPVEGEFVVIRDSETMLSTIKKEDLPEYLEMLKQKGENYLKTYEKYKKAI